MNIRNASFSLYCLTNNPKISLAFTITSYKKPWGGLGKSPSQWPYAAIDDSPSQNAWWSAIGSTRVYNGGIPGPRYSVDAQANTLGVVKKVQLFVQNRASGKLITQSNRL